MKYKIIKKYLCEICDFNTYHLDEIQSHVEKPLKGLPVGLVYKINADIDENINFVLDVKFDSNHIGEHSFITNKNNSSTINFNFFKRLYLKNKYLLLSKKEFYFIEKNYSSFLEDKGIDKLVRTTDYLDSILK